MRYSTCGDAAFTVELGPRANLLLTRTIAALHEALRREAPEGFLESVPGLTSLTVIFDPDRTCAATLQAALERCRDTALASSPQSREWHLPVCYAAEYAPDLAEVARACNLSEAQVIAAHASRSYTVYLLGFSPGFPYLGDVDERLVLPRRTEPRPRIAAGSVAIATQYTAVYPQATAGGWHIIGRTPVTLFDAAASPPALLAPGDTVRFYAIDAAELARIEADGALDRDPLRA
jgi:KipI family sensor histidine kinase inhibitor